MNAFMKRRHFLQAFAGAGLLTACGSESGESPSHPKKVVVLGAGLAGLTAAHQLMKAGFDVLVLEAQTRVGGRVYTARSGFANGQYAELGAIRIPDVHEHTLDMVRELGLGTVEFPSGDPLYFLQGTRFQHTEGQPWPLAGLSAAEKERGLDMWDEYIKANFGEFGNPRDGSFPKADTFSKYDRMTLADFLRSKGATEDFLTLYRSDNGTEVDRIGAIPWMAAEVADQDWDKTFHIQGGNDQLPNQLASRLGDRVKLEHVVRRIEHDATGVTVTYDRAGVTETVRAAHCVCAIPFSVLRDIAIAPAFTETKTRAIRELFMMAASRACFQTKTPFWSAEGIGGLKIAKTDTKAERIWDLTRVQATQTQGLFVSYMQHENALAFARVPVEGRQEYALAEIEKFFPNVRGEVVAFAQYAWSEDPWVKGAWWDVLPEQAWMFDVVWRPEGRVHFAGEHTSIWSGWMQGAIESGKRAALEVVGAVG